METLQLQCGHCQKVMAISIEHLGGQVQCPHCRTVVQTPPASKANAAPAMSPQATMEWNERDSIFAGAEASEDVIGGSAAPQLERSPVAKAASRSQPEPREPAAPAKEPAPMVSPEAQTAPAPNDDVDLTVFKRRPIYDKNIVPVLALIFLVPYAITTTLFIIYLLLYAAPSRPHPLDVMPDPKPSKDKGGPRPTAYFQTIHNYPLADHQKTPLGKSIRIGNIIMTPEHVRLTTDGNLQLSMRARNMSANTAFEPINDFFVRYSPSRENDGEEGKPYTFLESKSKSVAIVYGGFLEYRKKVQGKEVLAPTGVLNPNEEEIVVLTTMDNYHPHVRTIAKTNNEEYVWRVQVRRGFVKHNGKDISATAVFGVEFTSQQIERDTKKT